MPAPTRRGFAATFADLACRTAVLCGLLVCGTSLANVRPGGDDPSGPGDGPPHNYCREGDRISGTCGMPDACGADNPANCEHAGACECTMYKDDADPDHPPFCTCVIEEADPVDPI